MSDRRRRLTHAEYTVAWICALPCELTASLAVLDEIHADLHNPTGDHNVYSYGEVSGHNVVLTCLPAGVYGTTSAAAVSTRLQTTFESVTIPLMVGIGGGVPSPEHDIRLGDIVVSVPSSSPPCPAVVQHDFGKVIADGSFIRTGTLNKPASVLLSAVAKLQSIHKLGPSQVPSIILEALRNTTLRGQGFNYPGEKKDILYEPACEHVDELQDCMNCGPVKCINRSERANRDPVIFYGPIASGNSVIKNSRMRDRIAQPSGILCFEMEAAGLMDSLPCLVIRGICDYCDARKHKDFQPYAALAAAAFAKELLSIVPKAMPVRDRVRELILDALKFEEAEDRFMSIKPAHAETCSWILKDSVYYQWLDDTKLKDHHGLLWIKGKPGAGKSTLMKFVLEQNHTGYTALSFFFNARGKTQLEKSTSGLYRSLLFQLLKIYPTLKETVDWFDQPNNIRRWSLDILQNMFVSFIKAASKKPIIIFIDALDESSEDEIRDMVEVFDQLGDLTASGEIFMRVCYASRYYPHISTRAGLEIQMDKMRGHQHDMATYIHSELRIGAGKHVRDLEAELLHKSAGVFLWVVLVVKILRKEYDSGRVYNLSKKLEQLPPKLSDLFRDIIYRDVENLEQLLVCFQWLLYSTRPLSVPELYFAMHLSVSSNTEAAWDQTSLTIDDMARYISSNSKGLVEPELTFRWAVHAKVQFIHESVREMLLQPETMIEIWPGFEALEEGQSHEHLMTCCFQYLQRLDLPDINSLPPMPPYERRGPWERLCAANQFLHYSTQNILYHAEKASCCGHFQKYLVYSSDLHNRLYLYAVLIGDASNESIEEYATFLLTSLDLPELLSLRLSSETTQVRNRMLPRLLHIAIRQRSNKVLKLLIDAGADVNGQWNNCIHLFAAVLYGNVMGVDILIKAGAHDAFMAAEKLVEMATSVYNSISYVGSRDYRAVFFGISDRKTTPLHLAMRHGFPSILKALVYAGADLEARNSTGYTALTEAARYGDFEAIMILLESGADMEAKTNLINTPLIEAARRGHLEVVHLLIEAGVDLTTKNSLGYTALQYITKYFPDRAELIDLLKNAEEKLKLRQNERRCPLVEGSMAE